MALDYLKKIVKKYNYSHYPSAKTLFMSWVVVNYELEKYFQIHKKYPKIVLGKPFGFYAIVYYYRIINDITDNQMKSIFSLLNQYDFDGVLTFIQHNELKKLNYGDKFKKFINNIIYIDPTLGSAYTVAQGINDDCYVFIPDSYLQMGEFYEGLVINKLNKNKNITLFIDYNGSTKQNKIVLTIPEIEKLLKLFNQEVHIIDTVEVKNEL